MKFNNLVLISIALIPAITGCSSDAEDAANAAAAAAVAESESPKISNADLGRICRAAIAHMMGKDPAIMKVKSNSGGMVRIQYKRPDDGTIWKDDCRLEGERVMWRAVDAFAGSGPGRWRNHPADEVITYSLDGDKVTIHQRYSDGSNDSATFKIKA